MKTLALTLLLAVPAAAYDSIEFLEPIKIPDLEKPAAVAASPARIYALDEKRGIFIYDAAGKFVKNAGRFDGAKGFSVGPDGRLYVADTGNSIIQILDADGKLLSSFGNRGSDPGKLRNPESVAVGADGRIYIADTGNNRVEVFTADGILLAVFGTSGKGPGQFKGPTKIAVDPSDYVYVLDSGNDRIEKFDASARFVKELSLRGGDDFAVDSYGFLYVAVRGQGKVYEEDAEGKVLGPFGSKGAGQGQYKRLTAVAVAPDGKLLVLDSGNARIDRVDITNKLRTVPLPPNMETKLSASGPARSWKVDASVFAAFGADLYAWLPKEGKFVVLDEDGKEKARFGVHEGKGPEVTGEVGGLAASKKQGLFVSDPSNNRIQRLGLDGKWQANLAESTGMFDSKKKEGRVRDPRGVAINEQGTIYVADAGNRRVDAFSPEGTFLFGIGPKVGANGEYELREPSAVAWDKARFVYFVDKGLKKVFKCEPSGAFLAAWGEEGSGPGQFEEPVALAFDGNNYLYVLDAKLRRVSVFTKEGKWMTDLFSGGLGAQELSHPAAIAIQGARLLVSDQGKSIIATFDLHPSLASPAGVAAASKEGTVALTWKAVADPWTAQYRVYRSTQPLGPYAEIGKTELSKFEDSSVAPYEKYYYRVATEARTKDVGAPGAPVEIAVAGAFNRAPVEISTVAIGNVLSANYKWYLKNPVGKAAITNNVNLPFENVKFTFRLKEFMDFGYDTEIKKLEPNQTVEIPLIATLNNKILEVSEDTPVQAQLALTYYENGGERRLTLTKPMRVYSRNAITWDDPERIGNFITPKDPPILEFAREVLRQAPKNAKAASLNPNLVTAMHLWDALSETGVKFFANPNNPYETISEDPSFPVDYTQFPRETLKRKSGQCDDLTTLIISMLDSAKVRAAILDFPGHMALMFDTEAEAAEEAGLPEDMLVPHDGTYWVPLEATLVGKGFPEAARKAAYAYKTEGAKGKARILDVRHAWETYEPATLPAKDWDAEVPPVDTRQKRFDGEASELFDTRYKFLKETYAGRLKENPADADARVELGLLELDGGDRAAAAKQFDEAVKRDPQNAAALNNLGSLSFLNGDYPAAEERYLKSTEADATDPDVWLNLEKTAVQLKDKVKAGQYGAKAVALDAKLSPSVETLLKAL